MKKIEIVLEKLFSENLFTEDLNVYKEFCKLLEKNKRNKHVLSAICYYTLNHLRRNEIEFYGLKGKDKINKKAEVQYFRIFYKQAKEMFRLLKISLQS